jgi:hypothetical protein
MSDIVYNIIVSLIVIFILYIIFIVIIVVFNPEFYNSDGSINWLTPLWITIIIYIFFAIFIGIMVECLA